MADGSSPSPGLANLFAWLLTPDGQAAVAGAAGGLVRTLTLRDDWREGVPNLIVGCICAIYLHPLALPMLAPTVGRLDVPAESLVGLSGLVMGIGGMSITGFILDIIKARRAGVAKRDDDAEGGP